MILLKFTQLKLVLRTCKKVNKYYVKFEIQNSNFGTLANQHMCYQGHKMKIPKRVHMPCPFTGCKMFCAGPNFLCQIKNLFTYWARQKDDLHSVKLVFVPTQKCLKTH